MSTNKILRPSKLGVIYKATLDYRHSIEWIEDNDLELFEYEFRHWMRCAIDIFERDC